MKLWQLKVGMVRGPNESILVRLHTRNDVPVFDGRPYRDLDVSKALRDEAIFDKAVALIRELGFRFPLPLKAMACATILSLQDFPTEEQWEKLGASYDRADYLHDLNLWWTEKFTSKTFEEQYRRIAKSVSNTRHRTRSTQDIAAYARLAYDGSIEALDRLKEFYPDVAMPNQVERALKMLYGVGQSFIPEPRHNKKKMGGSAATTNEGAIKSKRKRNSQIDGQATYGNRFD